MPDDDADDRRLRLTDDADEPTDGRDDAEADEQGEGRAARAGDARASAATRWSSRCWCC
ncbi:hypothetical protein [Barrientosiimonas endolithica]|uniref:hypothetical protein n=1 Tax=Barrientosiimonas endolithica TaxID=1535208 RepID=UPI00259BE89A|nr:hypothetical protein [Barrientosiimonas endolithica]